MNPVARLRGTGLAAIWMLSAAALASAQPKSAPDPFLGTWVLNVAKSNYSPGPPPKEQTVLYEAAGEAVKVTSRTTDATGKMITTVYTAGFDGNDSPVTGNPDFDAISQKRVNPNTVEFTRKRAKKVVMTGTNVVSADGRTRTITLSGVDGLGRRVMSTIIYDKK